MNNKYLIPLLLLFVLGFQTLINVEINKLRTPEVIKRSLSGNLPESIVEREIELSQNGYKSTYVKSPVYKFLKILVNCVIVLIGVYLFSVKEVVFKTILLCVLIAETVLVVSSGLKFVALKFIKENLTLQYINYYEPLSALDIVSLNTLDFPNIFVLRFFSVFNFLYLFILARSLSVFSKTTFDITSKLVLKSFFAFYGLYLVASYFLFSIF